MAGTILRWGPPREVRAGQYLTGFVVATVGTILVTRGVLALSGYPKLGGHGLHIAHVLWGGLVMAVAIVAGIGFGRCIDEVGKFVSANLREPVPATARR